VSVGDLIPSANIPDFLKNLTLTSLLSHTSGLPPWINYWVNRIHPDSVLSELANDRHHHIETVLGRSRIWPTGKGGQDCYSDVGYILLGYLFEKFTGKALEPEFYKAVLVDSTGQMADKIYGPSKMASHQEESIPTAFCPLRDRALKGEVHDENAFSLGGFMGHAGLFGSGPSVGTLIRENRRYPLFRAYFEQNQDILLNSNRVGLAGMRRGTDSGSLDFAAGQSMGHLGFTGTGFWVDVRKGTYVILLTNRVQFKRIMPEIQPFRRHILQIVESSL
jgi:CubicO group peptidase (beta-lactamase class C family)